MEEHLLTPIGGKDGYLFDKLNIIFENMRPPDLCRDPTLIQKRSCSNSSEDSSYDGLNTIKRSKSSSVVTDLADNLPVRFRFFFCQNMEFLYCFLFFF